MKATRFTWAWESFHAKIKAWAMKQDELVTTHPIAGAVPDTDATFLNFDGITYGKGASALKQLTAFLGEDAFRDGCRLYFKRHAYGNATLDDFLAALSQASGRDLAAWSRAWIETSGLGSLAAKVIVQDGKIASFAIEQEASPASPTTLRPHKVEVALFREDERGRAVPAEVVPVLVEGAKTVVPELEGRPAPLFVNPNHGDHAYAKIVLDPASLAYVRERLERIDEPLVKTTLWGTLWQMVRDRRLSAADYVDLVATKAQHETAPEIVESLAGNAGSALVRYLGPSLSGGPDLSALETRGRAALVTRCWSRLDETKGDLQLTWLRATISLAREAKDLARLVGLMDGLESIPGVVIDQEMRWSIIAKLVAHGVEGSLARLAAERVRDPSDRGAKQAFFVEASQPKLEEKERVFALFTGSSDHSSDFLKSGMRGFHWSHQAALLDPFVGRYFDAVPAVFDNRSPEYAKAFTLLLYPGYRAETAVLSRAERAIAVSSNRTLERLLLEANDELSRSLRCREFAARKS